MFHFRTLLHTFFINTSTSYWIIRTRVKSLCKDKQVKWYFQEGKLTDKPGSVVDNHSSRPYVTAKLMQPTQIQSGLDY